MPLQSRDHDLAHEVEYILDSATEENEILGFHRAILDLYGDQKAIDGILEQSRERVGGKKHLRWRRGMTLDLCRYAEALFDEVAEEIRPGLIEAAYAHARKIVAEYGDMLAGWNFEDVVKGGCAVDTHYRRIRRDQSPTKGAARHLRSPKAIRRYVRLDRDTLDFLPERLAVLNRFARPADVRAGDAYMAALDDMIRIRRDRQYAAMAEIVARHKAGRDKPWKVKREERSRRKIITRAAVMAVGVLGSASVSAFAQGKPVRIEGQEIAFEIRARGSLAAMGYGAMDVTIVGLDGAKLSNLCVYHDQTPALDQLTAMALRVAAGQEREIIKTGNLFNVRAGAADHDLLKGRLVAPPIERADFLRATWSRDSAFQKHRDAYVREFGPFYREAVALRLFGRRAKEFL